MSDLLTEGGKTSSMRVGMFVCIGTSCYLAIAGLHMGADLLQLTGIIALFLGAGITGKVAQKSKEEVK
jgi:hypothetical protein